MQKKRILFCSEATFLNTGYATYTREILNYLHGTGKYEIAELGSYGQRNDPRAANIPWKYYGVAPNTECEPKATEEELKMYNSSGTNQFGEWIFEHVCLDFMPDVVCLPPKALVHTENGYRPISKIKVGERVMTHKGRYKKVLKTMRHQHEGTTVRIRANGDSKYMQLTEEHPVWVYRKRPQTNKKKSRKEIYLGVDPEFVPAKDVKVGDLVVLPRTKTERLETHEVINIQDLLEDFIEDRNLLFPTRVTNCKGILKNIVVNHGFSTLIGYIIGDGSVDKSGISITFNIHEMDFAKDAKSLFESVFGLSASITKNENKSCLTVICNSVLLSEFIEGFLGKKEEKRIPSLILKSKDLEVKRGILRGLFRSDGCYKKNTVSFTSKMPHLAYEVRQICVDVDIPVSITHKKNSSDVEGYGESAKMLHDIVLKKDIERLELVDEAVRRPRSTQIINGHMVAAVKRVRVENYKGQVYNLEVEDDNSYISNWCVHNCDIRDFWMCDHIERSPFRDYFKWALMPTVDARPQARQWVSTYASADGVLTYSDWAGDVLKEQSGGKIKYHGSAPPSAHPAYKPVEDKNAHKLQYGIDPKYKIIGTVMRNQRRKLYPDLFEAFRLFLDKADSPHYYLYCHTSYPDLGWDIPELILQNDLSSHVLFTYICPETKKPFPSLFKGAVVQSPFTGKWGSTLSNVKNGASYEDLSNIINLFDLYTQYANCLLPGQEVSTKYGWKNIEDITDKDIVLTHKNRWRPVSQTFEHYVEKDVYTFGVHSDYETLSVTDEHPFYVLNQENCGYTEHKRSFREWIGLKLKDGSFDLTPQFVEAESVNVGDFIAYPIDRSEKDHKIDLYEYLTDGYDTYHNSEDIFVYNHINTDVEHPLYIDVDDDFVRWLGLYVADGYSNTGKNNGSVCITSHIDEIECQHLTKRVLSSLGKVSSGGYKDKNAIDTKLYNKVFAFYLKDKCGKYTQKRFPEWVMTLPVQQQKQALHGLFMGDGCYLESKNTSILCTISKSLAIQVKQLCRRIGLNYNVRIVEKEGNRQPQYRFEIRGNVKNGEFDTSRSNSRNFTHGDYYYYQVKSIDVAKYEGLVYNFEVVEDNSYVTHVGVTHNCEGFGLPQVEAAACGIPVCGTDYSAMESVLRKLEGYPIKPAALYKELETGCLRAVPDNEAASEMFLDFFERDKNDEDRAKIGKRTRENFEKYFQWHLSGSKWEEIFDGFPDLPIEATWAAPPKLHNPAPKLPQDQVHSSDASQLAKWLIVNVLGDPSKLNTFFEARLTRDLTYKNATGSTGGMYFNESSAAFDGANHRSHFDFDSAYQQMVNICQRRNNWEQKRMEVMKQRGVVK